MQPTLLEQGDSNERTEWPKNSVYVPHYEEFWRRYVFPLRATDGIWFRRNIDPRLERIAITSYSAFLSFARARFKIFEDNEQFRYVEELYMYLQRSLEIMVKLASFFGEVETEFTGRKRTVDPNTLANFIDERLKLYRNRLHEPIGAQPRVDGGRLIPRAVKIQEYELWTHVMYAFRQEDFVSAERQVMEDFDATAAMLEESWRKMSTALERLSDNPGFLTFLRAGADQQGFSATRSLGASGDFFLGSETASVPQSQFIIEPLHNRQQRRTRKHR